MVPRIPPIFWLWNQHTQFHCLGTCNPTLAGRQAGARLEGDISLVFSRGQIVVQPEHSWLLPLCCILGNVEVPERTKP